MLFTQLKIADDKSEIEKIFVFIENSNWAINSSYKLTF